MRLRILPVTIAVLLFPLAAAPADELKTIREANELFLAGVAAYEKDDTEGAIKKFEECLAKDPSNAHAQFNIGVCYSDLGDGDKALAAYRKTLSIDPNYADAYFNIGRIYHLRKNFAEAAANYEKALAKDPYSPDLLYNYAHALTEAGEVDKALDAWQRYLTIAEPLPDEGKWVERARGYVQTLEGLKNQEKKP